MDSNHQNPSKDSDEEPTRDEAELPQHSEINLLEERRNCSSNTLTFIRDNSGQPVSGELPVAFPEEGNSTSNSSWQPFHASASVPGFHIMTRVSSLNKNPAASTSATNVHHHFNSKELVKQMQLLAPARTATSEEANRRQLTNKEVKLFKARPSNERLFATPSFKSTDEILAMLENLASNVLPPGTESGVDRRRDSTAPRRRRSVIRTPILNDDCRIVGFHRNPKASSTKSKNPGKFINKKMTAPRSRAVPRNYRPRVIHHDDAYSIGAILGSICCISRSLQFGNWEANDASRILYAMGDIFALVSASLHFTDVKCWDDVASHKGWNKTSELYRNRPDSSARPMTFRRLMRSLKEVSAVVKRVKQRQQEQRSDGCRSAVVKRESKMWQNWEKRRRTDFVFAASFRRTIVTALLHFIFGLSFTEIFEIGSDHQKTYYGCFLLNNPHNIRIFHGCQIKKPTKE